MTRITLYDQPTALSILREHRRQMRLEKRTLGEHPADLIDAGGGGRVKYGKPQASHAAGATETYDLYDKDGVATGGTQSGVTNNTTQPLVTTVLHFVVPVRGGFTAFPAELASCTSTNPIS